MSNLTVLWNLSAGRRRGRGEGVGGKEEWKERKGKRGKEESKGRERRGRGR